MAAATTGASIASSSSSSITAVGDDPATLSPEQLSGMAESMASFMSGVSQGPSTVSAVSTGRTTSSIFNSASSNRTATYASPSPTTGGPLTNSPIVDDQAAAISGSTTGVKAGIAIGTIVAVVGAGLIAWFLIRRRRRNHRGNKLLSAARIERGQYHKAELSGGTIKRGNVYTPYDKPELAEVAKSSSQQDFFPQNRHELSGQRIHEAPSQHEHFREMATTMADRRLDIAAPDSVANQAPSTRVTAVTEEEDINALKAREREMAQQIEIDESLLRLKAEQAALQDRIRLAEMRRRDMRGG